MVKKLVISNPKFIFDVELDQRKIWLRSDKGQMEILTLTKEDFLEAVKIIVDEIKSRPDPLDRVEDWETKNKYGMYSQEIYSNLLNSRRNLNSKKKFIKINTAKSDPKTDRAKKIDEFLDYIGADKKWGEMYLTELAADKSPANEEKRLIARRYGLI